MGENFSNSIKKEEKNIFINYIWNERSLPMNFSKEFTDFPSTVHKTIYSNAREVIPLNLSLTDINDHSLRTSCEAYHQFIMDMLSDMYECPEAYCFPVLELENYLGGNKVNGMKQKYPSKTKDILSRTGNVVSRYMVLLSKLAFMGTPFNDRLEISEDVFPSIENVVNSLTSPISLEKRLNALSRIGLIQTGTGFISTRHPNMFLAMCALAQKTKGKTSGFGFYNFTKVDFRNIIKNYKPKYSDYFLPLTETSKKIAYQLHDIAAEYRCRPTVSTFLKVDYKYKGTHVMCIDSSGSNLHIRLTGAYGWDDKTVINQRLEKEPLEFQKQVLRHIWRCNACSTSHLGQFVEVLGKRQRVCGGGQIGFLWRNPTDQDINIIRHLIELRCEIINEINQCIL